MQDGLESKRYETRAVGWTNVTLGWMLILVGFMGHADPWEINLEQWLRIRCNGL